MSSLETLLAKQGITRSKLETNHTLERGEKFLKLISDICLEQRAIAPSFIKQFELIDYNEIRTEQDGQRRWQKQWCIALKQEDGSVWQYIVESAKDKRGYAYLAPAKVGNRAFKPAIPPDIRRAISKRNNVDVPLEGSFWDWLETDNAAKRIPVLPTEGAGKALAALSQGYVSIALFGCFCLGSEDLKPFLKDRDVLIALDSDNKASAKLAVNRALSKHIKPIGEIAKSVNVLAWDSQHKGLDDLLANCGTDALDQAIKAATAADKWKFWADVEIAKERIAKFEHLTADLEIPTLQGLTWADIEKLTSNARDTVIVAPTAAGKSILGGDFLNSHAGSYRLTPTHRELLAKSNAAKFGAEYRTDCTSHKKDLFGADGSYVTSLSYCNEGYMAIAKPVENMLTQGAIAFNDELDQQLESLATSSTHGNDGRRKYNTHHFWQTQIRATKTLSVSADITDFEVAELTRNTGRKPFVIKVTPTKKQRTSYFYENFLEFFEKLKELRKAGLRIAVSCSRASDVEFLEFLGAVGLHSQNFNDPKFEGFAESPKDWLEQNKPKLFAYSPVLGTGFSITSDSFDAVFEWLHYDSITPKAARQQAERYRPQVPHHVYADLSNGRFDYCGKKSLIRTARAKTLIGKHDGEFNLIDENDPQFHYGSQANWSKAHYRAELLARMQLEIETAEYIPVSTPEGELKEMSKAYSKTRKRFKDFVETRLLTADNLTDEQATDYREKRKTLTQQQIIALEKYDLANWSCLVPEQVDLDRIQKDKKGKRRKSLERLEKQAFPELAIFADAKNRKQQDSWGHGRASQDLTFHKLKVDALTVIGANDFLDFVLAGNSWTNETPEAVAFGSNLIAQRSQLADLGIHLKAPKKGSTANYNAVVGSFLGWIGLVSDRSQTTNAADQRVSLYKLCQDSLKTTIADLNARAIRFIKAYGELKASIAFAERIYGAAHTYCNNNSQYVCADSLSNTECLPDIGLSEQVEIQPLKDQDKSPITTDPPPPVEEVALEKPVLQVGTTVKITAQGRYFDAVGVVKAVADSLYSVATTAARWTLDFDEKYLIVIA